jgi:hypothetical protein
MKYNILYETTNSVNGKKYAGIHVQTLHPNEFDGYLGSGIEDGWYAGRQMAKSNKQYIDNMIGTKRYTNGVDNIRLKETDTVPSGFYKGMTQKTVKRMWITDGANSKSVPIDSKINKGWERGRTL